jgi:type I restriction enzyme S subunit
LRRFVELNKNPLRLQRGDVLFNNTNSPAWVGKTALIDTDDELAFSNHMTRLRISEGVDPRIVAEQLHFLYRSGYFLQQCKKHVNQASINRSFLGESTPFMLPPLPEQRRIVSAIESLQERSSRARGALGEVGPLLKQFRQRGTLCLR